MSKKSTVTMNFMSGGSGSGQQQTQQQQQVVYQQQQQQRQPAQQQQSRARAQPQFEYNSEDDYVRSLHTTMSMRAPRAGDMFHNEMKMEKRYDEEEQRGVPAKLMMWFRDVVSTSQQGPPIPPPNGADFKSIHAYLCDGVVLCRVINRLLKSDGKQPVAYKRPKSSNMAINKMVWRANVESFLIGAKRYGVPDESLFEPNDIVEGRKAQGLGIINCLNALACVANAKGGCPVYEEPKAPIADYAKDECYD